MTEPLAARQTVSAGKIHLLDLSALKQQVGPKWDRMAEHVHHFFEAAIRRVLRAGDTFYRADELNYLVLFDQLSPEETALKCTAISEEVCRRLFGENGVQASLRNLVARVPAALTGDGPNERSALSALLEREGVEHIVTRHSGTKGATGTTMRVFANGHPTQRQYICLPDITFSYRPVWDVANNAVLTYLCQPTVSSTAAFNHRPGFWTAENEDDQALLDTHVLRECADRVGRLRTEGLRIILAVPVSFTTVARPRQWRDYHELLRLSLAEVSRDIAFVIFGIERSVPHVRLAQELPKLSRMAYRVFCVTECCDSAGRFAKTGAHGVGIVLSEADAETDVGTKVGKLGEEARASSLDAFALSVPSTSVILMAAHSGIRYLEGTAVRAPVDDPRHCFVQGIEDLYRAKRRVQPSTALEAVPPGP